MAKDYLHELIKGEAVPDASSEEETSSSSLEGQDKKEKKEVTGEASEASKTPGETETQ